MGLLSKIFKKKENSNGQFLYADYLNGFLPSFSQFGQDIYASDVVQQAIFSIVNELKKLDPVHVRKSGDLETAVEGNIQNVLNNPNPLMTTSDFIEKITWNLFLNCNSFVYPIWNGNTLVALYPLQPIQVDFIEDGAGKLYVKLFFISDNVTIPYENIIHIRYKYSVSEFMGGDVNGQPDNKALLETLKLNDSLLKGVSKALNMQTTINGIIKLKTMANIDRQKEAIAEFEKKLMSNESGLGVTDLSSDYIHIPKQTNLLDSTTLEFIDKKIFRWFGTSIAIVDGDYTPEQYEAFYQKTLEPIIKSMSEAFTKGLFSRRELGFNNKIRFYSKELIFMNTQQKIELFTLLGNQGGCYVNEVRSAFGLKPIADLNGVRMMSLNYINTDDASQYQLGNGQSDTNVGNGGKNESTGEEGNG